MSSKSGKKKDAAKEPNGLEKALKKALDDVTKLLGEARRAASAAEESAKKSKKSAKKAKKAAAKSAKGSGASGADAAAGLETSARPVDRTTDHVTPADGLPLPAADDPDMPSNAWTVARLRAAARERGVTGFATLRKNELIEALTAKPSA